MRPEYFLAVDLGKSQDFTALVLVERRVVDGPWDPALYAPRPVTVQRVRYAERIALRTEYVEVVRRVKQVMESPALDGVRHLVVDATGLGSPVVELLRRARMGCRIWAVSITGGEQESYGNELYRVPKRDLVVGLQLLFEQGGLQIAEGLPERDLLVKEMGDMQVKVTSAGNEQYEAGKSGEHDDLVSALSLACWAIRKRFGGMQIGYRGDRQLV